MNANTLYQFTNLDTLARAIGEKRILSVKVEWLFDEDADLSYLDQFESSDDKDEQGYYAKDQARKAEYGNSWCMEGCRAVAKCSIQMGESYARLQTFHSSGLWEIESDSDESYKREVEGEQLRELCESLRAWGFSQAELQKHFESNAL